MQKQSKKFIASIVLIGTTLGFSANLTLAAAGSSTPSSSINSGTVITPTYQAPSPTAPWIGNLQISPTTFDVGSTTAMDIKVDYQNLPGASEYPKVIIYKDGDAGKTDLSKNYIDYSMSKAMATAIASATKSGTTEIKWWAQASTSAFLPAGQYDVEASWQYNGSSLGPITQKVTVTNNGNVVPLNLYNVVASPNPFNPTTGDTMKFSFDLKGSAVGELNTVALRILNPAHAQIYADSLSNLGDGNYSFTWNGKDNLNQIQVNGNYAFVLQAHSSQNRVFMSPMAGFTLDSTVQNPAPASTPAAPSTPSTPSTPTQTSSNNCAGFTDISASDNNCATLTWVKNAGIFTGNADGTFNPGGLLQRDQITKVVLEAFNKYQTGTEYCGSGNPFPDVTDASWAREYICLGKNTMVNGVHIITGYQSGANAGLFLPGNSVTRSEFLAIVLRALPETLAKATVKPYSDVELGQWDTDFASYAAFHFSSVFPEPTLYRSKFVTRLEAAKVLFQLHSQGAI